MRIAMILPGLGRVRRGAEVAFLEIARGLSHFEGVQVTLFGSGEQDLPDLPRHVIPCRPREKFEGWPKFPAFRTECYYEEFSFTRNLSRSGSYRPSDFDLTVTCSYPWVNWFVNTKRRKGDRPVHVYVTQNGDWPCISKSKEFRFFGCDAVVCTNPIHYEHLQDKYSAALIPNGVTPERFYPRSELDREEFRHAWLEELDGKKVVAMVSALAPSKDVAGAIQALSLVPEAYLVVAGDGPERKTVTELAAKLLPGRHRLLGSVSPAEIPGILRSADAFLHMSRDEPFGIVYLEAAASGLPIVAHDGAIPRWILGDCALFADTSDTTAVASAIRRAIDPEVGMSLGREARRRVSEGWTWQAVADQYHSFFHELLSRRAEVANVR